MTARDDAADEARERALLEWAADGWATATERASFLAGWNNAVRSGWHAGVCSPCFRAGRAAARRYVRAQQEGSVGE